MATSARCPDCGSEIPADAREGLCRKCLLRVGLNDSDDIRPAPRQRIDAGEESLAMGTVSYSSVVPKFVSDRYKSERYHARGGIGIIHLARDEHLRRVVALKRLRDNKKHLKERFLAEAQITGQLEHPGVIPVYDLGVDQEGENFYTMKFIEGQTFEAAIDQLHGMKRAPQWEHDLARRRLLGRFLDVCDAVAYAHSRGVIHRDIKPDNIMLGSFGETYVLDWGLAKVRHQPELPGNSISSVSVTSSGRSTETRDGSVVGTAAYMSPEMAAGNVSEVAETCDVYLLGATLYRLLTGRAPRRGSSHDEMIEMARTVPPVPPREYDSKTPPSLEAICLKAMAKQASDRYQCVEELAEDIRHFLAGEPVVAYPESLSARSWRWVSRHRRVISRAVSIAAIVVLAIWGGAAVLQARTARGIAAAEKQKRESENRLRSEVQSFQELYKTALFHIGHDESDEKFTYFNPVAGLDEVNEALAISAKWEPDLSDLPIPIESREELKHDVYDLLLLRVQLALWAEIDDVQPLLADLHRARQLLTGPTRGFYRLSAECYDESDDVSKRDESLRLAGHPETPSRAMEHFLRGEYLRKNLGAGSSLAAADPLALPRRRDFQLAIEAYQAALMIDPQHYWSLLQLGRCYLGTGRPTEALGPLQACIALEPDSPWAYSVRGLAYSALGRFDEAHEDFAAALDRDSEFHPARLNRGWVYLRQGDRALAIAEFEAVRSSSHKPLAQAAYYLGRICFLQEDYSQARSYFDRFARDTAPNKPFRPVYRDLADVEYLLGNDDAGLIHLNRYLELAGIDPFDADGPEAAYHRGRYLRELVTGVMEEQIAAARNALSAAQTDAEKQLIASDLGNLIRRRDKILNLSLAEFESAERQPSGDLYYEKGIVLDTLERTADARDTYAKGLETDPNHIKLRYRNGLESLSDEQFEAARTEFAHAVRSKPTDAKDTVLLPDSHALLGYLMARGGDSLAAEREAMQALLLLDEVDSGDNTVFKETYAVLHDIACIYGELSKADPAQKTVLEDLALRFLERAIHRAERFSEKNIEMRTIGREPAFGPSLRSRAEFIQLTNPVP